MVQYTTEVLKSNQYLQNLHSSELIYNVEKLIQTAIIWLSCTTYVISVGLLWWIS